jgi:hypothetical protein
LNFRKFVQYRNHGNLIYFQKSFLQNFYTM